MSSTYDLTTSIRYLPSFPTVTLCTNIPSAPCYCRLPDTIFTDQHSLEALGQAPMTRVAYVYLSLGADCDIE
jgi:hypothetical protein